MHRALSVLVLCLAAMPATAQDTPEGRLRDLLRRTTAELRATQDSQSALQAALDQEKQTTANLQKQLDELTARQTQAARPSLSEDQLARLRAETQARTATLEAGLKQWQDAYQKAADVARAKDQESRIATAQSAEWQRQASLCGAANTRLERVANDILHLYQTQSFRSLLIGSYEPLLGLKKVELENTIQDYEDKLLDQKYRPGSGPVGTTK
jgi:chromosome segregation ATPase